MIVAASIILVLFLYLFGVFVRKTSPFSVLSRVNSWKITPVYGLVPSSLPQFSATF